MSSSSDWLSESEAIALADNPDTSSLAKMASKLRDSHHGDLITYSRKVFVPLTQLCRDVCHYCTFAQTPRRLNQAFMTTEEVVALCQASAKLGC
ncbi:MAG: 7,8-didemethyl-8-hydroxy-5-deazariboflavin synthase, partial [Pseudomonadota bacterium]|nr:7,8-didemethyl-8-hydroxy-5-deazariboflavin synthase [Pseudomonadota bacterium]